jgi:hypothetical protein
MKGVFGCAALMLLILLPGCIQGGEAYVCTSGVKVDDPDKCPPPASKATGTPPRAPASTPAFPATPQEAAQTTSTAASPPPDTTGVKVHQFALGKQDIDGSSVTFDFPGGGGTLYMFNLVKWAAKMPYPKTRLTVRLYDGQRRLVEKGSSVCVSEKMGAFGSIPLSGIDGGNVAKVSFFSLTLEECASSEDARPDETLPEVIFARKVEKAVKMGDREFYALMARPPDAEETMIYPFIAEQIRDLESGGGGISGVVPDEGRTTSAGDPVYTVTFEKGGPSEGMSMGLPIGRVNGEWRVLSAQDMKKIG